MYCYWPVDLARFSVWYDIIREYYGSVSQSQEIWIVCLNVIECFYSIFVIGILFNVLCSKSAIH